MPETIKRVKLIEQIEEVEIPDGHAKCMVCKGKGNVSDYDLGWRSLTHSPGLSAIKPCPGCFGDGYVPKVIHGEKKW